MTLSLQCRGGNLASFVRQADETYTVAGFSSDQIFFIMNKAAVFSEEMRSFVVLNAPYSYENLMKALIQYQESKEMVGQARPSASDRHVSMSDNMLRGELSNVSNNKEDKIEAFASQLAELSLLVKKDGPSGALKEGKHGAPQVGGGDISRFGYCRKLGPSERSSWKKGREEHLEKSCSYCGKPGHDESDCWMKKRREEAGRSEKDEPANVGDS